MKTTSTHRRNLQISMPLEVSETQVKPNSYIKLILYNQRITQNTQSQSKIGNSRSSCSLSNHPTDDLRTPEECYIYRKRAHKHPHSRGVPCFCLHMCITLFNPIETTSRQKLGNSIKDNHQSHKSLNPTNPGSDNRNFSHHPIKCSNTS